MEKSSKKSDKESKKKDREDDNKKPKRTNGGDSEQASRGTAEYNPNLTTIRDLVQNRFIAPGTKVEVRWASNGGGYKEGMIDEEGYIITDQGRYPTPTRFLAAYSGGCTTSGWSRVMLLNHSIPGEKRLIDVKNKYDRMREQGHLKQKSKTKKKRPRVEEPVYVEIGPEPEAGGNASTRPSYNFGRAHTLMLSYIASTFTQCRSLYSRTFNLNLPESISDSKPTSRRKKDILARRRAGSREAEVDAEAIQSDDEYREGGGEGGKRRKKSRKKEKKGEEGPKDDEPDEENEEVDIENDEQALAEAADAVEVREQQARTGGKSPPTVVANDS